MNAFLVLLATGSLLAQQPTVSALQALLEKHPKPEAEAPVRLQLLTIYEKRADWSSAAQQLERLRQLAPDEPEYAYQLGAIYQRISKASFERMRLIAPDCGRVQQIFGEQYSVTGETAKAIRAYRAAIAAAPTLEGSHLALAMLYLQRGNVREAQAEIQSELCVAPESAMAHQLAQSIQQSAQKKPESLSP